MAMRIWRAMFAIRAGLARQRRQLQQRDVVEISQPVGSRVDGRSVGSDRAPAVVERERTTGAEGLHAAGISDGAQFVLPALRAPLLDAARTIPVSTDAPVLWARVKAPAAARFSPTHRAFVEDLVAFDLAGDTLTCVTSTEFTLQMLESAGLSGIESELSTATAGTVSRLQIEAFRPGRHTRQP